MGGADESEEKRDLPWSAPPQPPSQPLAIAAEGQGWGEVGERQRAPLPIVSSTPGVPWGHLLQSTGTDPAHWSRVQQLGARGERVSSQRLSCPSWVTPHCKRIHHLPLTVKRRINLISTGDGLGACLISEVESRWGHRQ